MLPIIKLIKSMTYQPLPFPFIDIKKLKILSISYLLLPYCFFFLGYLKWYLALSMTAIMAYAFFLNILAILKAGAFDGGLTNVNTNTNTNTNINININTSNSIKVRPYQLLWIILLLVGWSYFSGMGEYNFQNSDYLKHNAVTSDLLKYSWPVSYTTGNHDSKYYLVYSLAYYLPVAAIGKILDPLWVNQLAFIWGTTGTLLVVCWFIYLARKIYWWVPLFLIFFSGLDIAGIYLSGKSFPDNRHLEWWSGFWQYSSNSTLLFWVPQHMLGGWLSSLLVFDSLGGQTDTSPHRQLFIPWYVSLTSLWSPFVTLGLIPFVLLGPVLNGVKRHLNFNNIVAASVIGILTLTYYQANLMHHPSNSFLPMLKDPDVLLKYLLFNFFEHFIFIAALFFIYKKLDRKIKIILWVTTISLFLIPLYKLGIFNDFCMRVSIPSLFILQILLLMALSNKFIQSKWGNVLYKVAIVVVLLIGSVTPLTEFSKTFVYKNYVISNSSGLGNFEPYYAIQYLGGEDTFFFKYFAKEKMAKDKINVDSSPLSPKLEFMIKNNITYDKN